MSDSIKKDALRITQEMVKPMLDARFIRVYDLQYEEGRHYYDASRKKAEDLTAVLSDEEFKKALPDGITCYVILRLPNEEPKLLTFYEYRYPTGRYLLSVPAGLVDSRDTGSQNPVLDAAVREIREETGVSVTDKDRIAVINPLAFSSPGMTDESNALVCAVVDLKDTSSLTHSGIEGGERMEGFRLLTKEEARKILHAGRDEYGNTFSLMTWTALLYFISDLWTTI